MDLFNPNKCKLILGDLKYSINKIQYIDVIELARGPHWGNIGQVLFLQVYGPS